MPPAEVPAAADPPPRPPAAEPVPPPVGPKRVRFADLAGDAVEVEIEHAGRLYRLRRTRAGKLLLTK